MYAHQGRYLRDFCGVDGGGAGLVDHGPHAGVAHDVCGDDHVFARSGGRFEGFAGAKQCGDIGGACNGACYHQHVAVGVVGSGGAV